MTWNFFSKTKRGLSKFLSEITFCFRLSFWLSDCDVVKWKFWKIFIHPMWVWKCINAFRVASDQFYHRSFEIFESLSSLMIRLNLKSQIFKDFFEKKMKNHGRSVLWEKMKFEVECAFRKKINKYINWRYKPQKNTFGNTEATLEDAKRRKV